MYYFFVPIFHLHAVNPRIYINDWISHDVMTRMYSLTFFWINRKSSDFNEKTLLNESAFLQVSLYILNILNILMVIGLKSAY